MLTDQQIQLLNAAGTWFAGLATLAAVIVSLWLARRADRLDLAVQVGIRLIIEGDGSEPLQVLSFHVTNRGQRPVTITNIGWSIGRGRKKLMCIQTVAHPFSSRTPVELPHGKSANFLVSFAVKPSWAEQFASKFLPDRSESTLRALRAWVSTSVGESVVVKPEDNVLKVLSSQS